MAAIKPLLSFAFLLTPLDTLSHVSDTGNCRHSRHRVDTEAN
jgi:hypothetical protein